MFLGHDWSLYVCAMVGAFFLYVVVTAFGRHPISILRACQVEMEGRPSIIFADMLATSVILAVLVTIFLEPCSPKDAVLGGLGSSGLLSSFGRTS